MLGICMDSSAAGARMSLLIVRKGLGERPGPASWGQAVPWGSWECFAVPGFFEGSGTRVIVRIVSGAGQVGRGRREPDHLPMIAGGSRVPMR